MAEKITMIELFSGIGAQERALRQLNIPYEIISTCDCDKDAVLSYASMRNDFEYELNSYDFPSVENMIAELQSKNIGFDFTKGKHTITTRTPINKLKQYYLADKLSKNLGDISKVEKLPYADLVTYSFCCQDLSCAGKGEGMKLKCDECGTSCIIDFEHPENNNICPNCGNTNIASTRSGLLWQVQRLLSVAHENNELPKYLLLENVKNLIGKNFKSQFDAWVKWLDSIGYNTYYEVLNAKHFGIPQNRERIFAVSIRKDIDNGEFKFPEKIPLTTRLKDMLEKNVDEKYYLPNDRIEKILNSNFIQEKKRIQMTDVCDTLLARDWKDPKCVPVEEPFIVASRGRNPDNPSDRTAGAPTEQRLEPNFSGCTNTLTSVQKDNYVAEPIIVDDMYANREPRFYSDAAPTLRSERSGLKVAEGDIKYRIRKLTAKECWRLMGFTDEDHDRAAKYISASARYKQAGNSICTCCLVAIFNALFLEDYGTSYKDKLVDYNS